MKLHGLREYVCEKLEEIKFFYPLNASSIIVEETETNEKKSVDTQKPLNKVTIHSIPTLSDIWIIENEFSQMNIFTKMTPLNSQKGAFSSAGSKVEKTALYLLNNKLYVLMFEMKRTLSGNKFYEIHKKISTSLNNISILLLAHSCFSILEKNITLKPVGICCYNYTSDGENAYNANNEIEKECQEKIIRNGKNIFLQNVSPITLEQMRIPFLFYQNPNDPLTDNFEINFQDILTQINLTYT